MTQTSLQLWPEIIWVTAGAVVLTVFAIAFAIRPRVKRLPGSEGERQQSGGFDIQGLRADRFIEGFAKETEEAYGGLTLLMKIALVGIPLWWLLYLIFNWTAR